MTGTLLRVFWQSSQCPCVTISVVLFIAICYMNSLGNIFCAFCWDFWALLHQRSFAMVHVFLPMNILLCFLEQS